MLDLLYRSGTSLGNFHVFIYARASLHYWTPSEFDETRRATMLEF